MSASQYNRNVLEAFAMCVDEGLPVPESTLQFMAHGAREALAGNRDPFGIRQPRGHPANDYQSFEYWAPWFAEHCDPDNDQWAQGGEEARGGCIAALLKLHCVGRQCVNRMKDYEAAFTGTDVWLPWEYVDEYCKRLGRDPNTGTEYRMQQAHIAGLRKVNNTIVERELAEPGQWDPDDGN